MTCTCLEVLRRLSDTHLDLLVNILVCIEDQLSEAQATVRYSVRTNQYEHSKPSAKMNLSCAQAVP